VEEIAIAKAAKDAAKIANADLDDRVAKQGYGQGLLWP